MRLLSVAGGERCSDVALVVAQRFGYVDRPDRSRCSGRCAWPGSRFRAAQPIVQRQRAAEVNRGLGFCSTHHGAADFALVTGCVALDRDGSIRPRQRCVMPRCRGRKRIADHGCRSVQSCNVRAASKHDVADRTAVKTTLKRRRSTRAGRRASRRRPCKAILGPSLRLRDDAAGESRDDRGPALPVGRRSRMLISRPARSSWVACCTAMPWQPERLRGRCGRRA